MKILILNTSEKAGGAAIAANRLMNALNKQCIEANMLVLNKQSNSSSVYTIKTSWLKEKFLFLKFIWERFRIFIANGYSKEKLFKVSIANTGEDISKHPLVYEADIIHLHWINQGFISLDNIEQLVALNKPIVWTMHDMWCATAICHHAYTCELYKTRCDKCVFLKEKSKDLSYKVWLIKNKDFYNKINFVAVSKWLQQKAFQSNLINGDVHVIANTLDKQKYSPISRERALLELGLSPSKKYIAVGAAKLNDPIKGLDNLKKSLSIIAKHHKDVILLLFGEVKGDDSFFDNFPVEYVYYSNLQSEYKISLIYSVSHLTVVPSFYETFGQTIIESMACMTPVVSFDEGGQTDIISHLGNGYLAKAWDVEDFARGIEYLLESENYDSIVKNGFDKVTQFYSEDYIASQYIALYSSLLT